MSFPIFLSLLRNISERSERGQLSKKSMKWIMPFYHSRKAWSYSQSIQTGVKDESEPCDEKRFEGKSFEYEWIM
jgi:hypothetical protein